MQTYYIFTGVILAFVLLFHKKLKVSGLLGALSVLTIAFGLYLCVVGSQFGIIYSNPTSKPQDTIDCFFDNIVSGNYTDAYSCLENYSELGLEEIPTDESTANIIDALHKSYSYSVVKAAEIDGISSCGMVEFKSLDIEKMQGSLNSEIVAILSELVDKNDYEYVYDENDNYRQNVIDYAYEEALNNILEDSDKYILSTELLINLDYDGEQWLIVADEKLISALCGLTD